MTFGQHRYYDATCDVRLNQTGNPLVPQPGPDEWAAYVADGRPSSGPLYDALGQACGAQSAKEYAPSATVAKRKLMGAGWKIVSRGRHLSSKSACPEHREHLES